MGNITYLSIQRSIEVYNKLLMCGITLCAVSDSEDNIDTAVLKSKTKDIPFKCINLGAD